MKPILHVRISPQMAHDLDELVKLTPYETVSSYIRALIRSEILAYKAEGQLQQEENDNDPQKC